MDKPLPNNSASTARATPKDFFLWAGAMVTLYWSVFSFISLIFDYINYTFSNPLNPPPVDPYQSGISYEMSSLIILGLLCIVLLWFIHRSIERDPTRADIWVRRWALYLTLFAAGATIAVDLIVLLTAFLNGSDLTASFLLKVALVLLVAAAGFMHFLADLRGYWTANPQKSKAASIAFGLLGILTVLSGFFIVGTPQQARAYRLDAQKVNDLQTIQYQVVTYWQQKQKLPTTLADLNDPISNFTAPVDEQTGQPYGYKVTGTMSFELCANFNEPSQDVLDSGVYSQPVMPQPAGISGNSIADNWQHGVGQVCFDRTIDPERYPPLNKTP